MRNCCRHTRWLVRQTRLKKWGLPEDPRASHQCGLLAVRRRCEAYHDSTLYLGYRLVSSTSHSVCDALARTSDAGSRSSTRALCLRWKEASGPTKCAREPGPVEARAGVELAAGGHVFMPGNSGEPIARRERIQHVRE
jgi:hypothetical protein